MLTRAPEFRTTTFQIDSSGDDGHGTDHEGQAAIVQARRHQQRAFQRAAEAVAGGDGAGSGDPASFGVEIRNLESRNGLMGSIWCRITPESMNPPAAKAPIGRLSQKSDFLT